MRVQTIAGVLFFSILFGSCATIKHKDITYLKDSKTTSEIDEPTLNIFTPRKSSEVKQPVLIFVHGGNWNSGDKSTYGFLGRNFAKKDVVTVIPGYTLSPNADYDTMATQISEAIQWTKDNIADYNGDPNQIFLTGHSAGGHLIALATMNPKYGIPNGTISGMIFNDAAGLDMHHYLTQKPPTQENNYLSTWSNDPKRWEDASPINFISEDTPPLLIYLGSKTYQSIKVSNDRFLKALKPYQPSVKPIVLNKKHIPMMIQYFWPWSKRYNDIIEFIEEN